MSHTDNRPADTHSTHCTHKQQPEQVFEQQLHQALELQELPVGIQYQLRQRRQQALAGKGTGKKLSWLPRLSPGLAVGTAGALATVAAVGWLTLLAPRFDAAAEFDLAMLEPAMIEDPMLLQDMELLLWLSEVDDEALQ